METMITFTPAQLVAFIGTIAGVCAGIATITGFIVALVKRWKAPEVEQNRRIETLEKKVEELEKRLGDGNNRFERIEETNIAILSTLRALLKHAINGNDIKALKEADKELDNFLITK